MSDPHPLDGLLEPASGPYRDAALISIAISLKRLVDYFDCPDKRDNPLRLILEALQQGPQL